MALSLLLGVVFGVIYLHGMWASWVARQSEKESLQTQIDFWKEIALQRVASSERKE